MKKKNPKIALIGVGGCGKNTLNTVLEYHPNIGAAMAVNR
jgi:cell division GTPase FtsZ